MMEMRKEMFVMESAGMTIAMSAIVLRALGSAG
jgi:hypothetical protein